MKDQNESEKKIDIEEDFLSRNKETSSLIKGLLEVHNVRAYDIMGSIGVGKSSLVMSLVKKLKNEKNIFAIAGDLTTQIDKNRIQSSGANVVQINTGLECHLNADAIYEIISNIDLNNYDLIFIENVGNLICPAGFSLGAEKRIIVISVTEGPYLVLKHPNTFLTADIVVINKTDLTKYVEVDPVQLENDLKKINPFASVVRCSCKTGDGIESLIGEILK